MLECLGKEAGDAGVDVTSCKKMHPVPEACTLFGNRREQEACVHTSGTGCIFLHNPPSARLSTGKTAVRAPHYIG